MIDINYAQIRKYDITNGVGIRSTLFVSGCRHNCNNCFNQEYQNFKYGEMWNEEIENKFISYIKSNNVIGCTILGGEPMQQTMDNDLINLLHRIKIETGKTIWIYSGYTYEEILKDEYKLKLLNQCDVLVDGRFIEELKDIRLRFRGSSNQRIILIQESLKTNNIVLYDN